MAVENSNFFAVLLVNFFCTIELLLLVNSCIPHQKKEMALRAPTINYRLKSEVSIMLHCQLCSTHFTALRIKNCSKNTSAIKVATMINMDNFHYEGKPSCATAKSTPFAVSYDEWDMKNALCILQYAKRWLKQRQTVKKSSP